MPPTTNRNGDRPYRISLAACENERAFSTRVLTCLAPWFFIDEQVTGLHPDGRRLRIDAVLRPTPTAGWRDENPAFGVEFKAEPTRMGDRMAHAAQAVDYSFVDWKGFGRLGVFMCAPGKGVLPVFMRTEPTDPIPPRQGWADPNFALAHLLGQFTVGELCYLGGWSTPTYPQHKWTLLINGDHVLWSEGHGVKEARRRTIRPKVGSR